MKINTNAFMRTGAALALILSAGGAIADELYGCP